MLPIYFIVGLINIFSQHHNYGIKIEDPNFDVRVRRSVEDTVKPLVFSTNNNVTNNYLKTDVLNGIKGRRNLEDTANQQDFNIQHNNLKTDVKRKKRYAYYKKTRITNNDLYRFTQFNNTQENKNNGSQHRNGSRYDIFNPNWNFLFNTTRNYSNNSGVNNGIINNNNKRPIIRSYPYGYPPGYGPKTNTATVGNGIPTTPVYINQNNNNTPFYYNYQNPDGQNFAGYIGHTENTPGFNNFTPGYSNIPVPYAPGYTPRPYNAGINNNWTNPLAPYPFNYTQNPLPTTTNNNFPYANNSSGIHNLPYAPANGVYNNTPTPFNKDNLYPYAPNFNNGSATPNNTFVPYSPVNNTYVTPRNSNSTGTTTEKITIFTGCVICNIPCPQFMRRFGRFCIPDYDE